MQANLHVWGGRYNPIVPVNENSISKEWIDLIKDYDPDFIYYSNKIHVEFLKGLNLFNPKEYIAFDNKDSRIYFPGLNIHNLLHVNVYDRFTTQKTTLLEYRGKWDMPLLAKKFYQLNLGLTPLYVGEDKWTSKYELISIDEKNSSQINKLIFEHRPYFKTNLSAIHIKSISPNSKNYFDFDKFQWIVYDSRNYLSNLLYFWNRQLYIEPNNRINQVVATIDEMDELLNDPFFEPLVYSLCHNNQAFLVSIGMASGNLEEMRKKMQTKCNNVRVFSESVSLFPFETNGFNFVTSKFIKPSKSLIIGKSDFLRIPTLTFEGGDLIDDGPYAIDILIEKDTKDDHKEIKFPYGTSLHHIALKGSTRINKSHRITFFLNREVQVVDFSIPDDLEIIRSVLNYREKQTELLQLPMAYIDLSPAGQKLSAFYNLFERDWATIKSFLEEKFWVQLFMYDSSIKKSPVKSGKGVFSYQDLVKEVTALTEKYRDQIVERLNKRAEQVVDEDIIKRIIERDIKETFQYYIDSDLSYLIKRGGLFIGMKVSCDMCGSNRWYSLTELSDKIKCKGCNNITMPNLTSKIYYKVSDIIINNLLSDQTKNSKQFDGNYVVLKTLLYLKNTYERSGSSSFLWCGPLGYGTQSKGDNWASDFDIVVILNGELILGEAKSQSKDFTVDEIEHLAWAANNLLPDKIIVACDSGNLDPIVEKVQEKITNTSCKVISYNASAPWYHFNGLFGLGD